MKLNYLRLMPRKDFQVWTILQQMAVTEQKLTLLNKIVLVTPELRTLVPRATKRPSSSPALVSVFALLQNSLVTGATFSIWDCERIGHEE